jgi:nicotinamidase/pyrazinamidase
MNKKFVVVVDAQNDFERSNGKLYVSGSEDLISAQNQFLDNLRYDTVEGVLFTFDTHDLDAYSTSEEGKMFPEHCIKGTSGWELAVNSHLKVPVYTLEKGVFDMWAEKDLKIGYNTRDAFFDRLIRQGVLDIDVIGVALNFCVKWAIVGLVNKGFRVTLYSGMTKGIDTGNGDKDTNPMLVFEEYIKSGAVTVV